MDGKEIGLQNNFELSQADQASLLWLYQEVAASLNLDDRMAKLSENMQRLLDLEQVDVIIFELASHRSGSVPDIPRRLVSQEMLEGKGLMGQAYQTRQVVASVNYWIDHSFEHIPEVDERLRRMGVVALIAVPICLGNDILGLLAGIKNASYHWTARDLLLAERAAEFSALAINNAQLHHNLKLNHEKLESRTAELENYTQELEARTAELEALQSFSRQLRGPLDLEELAKLAVSLSIQILHADYGALYLTDSSNSEQLNLLGGFHYPGANSQKPEDLNWVSPKNSTEATCWPERIRLDEGLTGKAAKLGQTVRVQNLAEELKESTILTLAQPNVWHSGLFIPLWLGEKMIGTINLASIEPRRFSEAQVHFAEMIAGQIAAAVHYVSQIEIERQQKELEAVLALARTAAHELNQPLTLLQGEVDMALQFGLSLELQTLERMQEAINHLAERVRAYQHIVRFETIEAVRGITILDPSKSIQE